MDRLELAHRITEVAQLSGTFLLRSGLTSNTYFDKYQFESDPTLLRAIGEQLTDLVPADTEMLAGLELGGVPVCAALSMATGLPAVFVRKTAKQYGTAKLAEGPPVDGRTLLIVEDIVTTGGQIVLSVADLRALGATAHTAVCVIDRRQGGAEALGAVGLNLRPLFTSADLQPAQPPRTN